MPSVDLICTYDETMGDVWTNGSNITVSNDAVAQINKGQYLYANLGFTTNAASAIPSGATKTSVQLILRARVQTYGGVAYLKDPGGFSDGGSASHSLSLTTVLTTYTSIDLAGDRPGILTDPLTSGYIRLFHTYSAVSTIYVDYLSLRVTYTEGGIALPLLYMNENF